jgi:hypothetical protein
MLRSLDEIRGYTLLATDGEIGRAKDFLFDDDRWTVRYLVADTGKWLPRRKVLLSPIFLDEPEWESQQIPVVLTKQMIENSPFLDEHAPVSRQVELDYYRYYSYAPYWIGTGPWGLYPTPAGYRAAATEADPELVWDAAKETSAHLRSIREVIGYHIAAADGEVGHVEDFVADTTTWTIRWLVVDTGKWLLGRKVLISPAWSESVSWSERKLEVVLTTEQIENSPKFDPSAPVNAGMETELFDYYGRPRQRV